MSHPYIRKKPKLTLLDLALTAVLALAAWYLLVRMQTGLDYKWSWGAVWQYILRYDEETAQWVPNLLLQGLFTTIRLSFWGTLLAVFIGVLGGLLRVSHSLFNRLLGSAYVELVRNLPPLVLVFIFYYFLSDQIMPVLGVETFIRNRTPFEKQLLALLFAPEARLPAFLSALVTLSVFEGAYITEIVRAGIESIEKGQWEASIALGMKRREQLWHVILPQAVKRILPPMAGQFISTIKDSAIVSVISIGELTFQGMELMAATYMTFEVWITVTVMYLLLTLSCSLWVSRLESKYKRNE